MALTVTNTGTLTADGSEQTIGAERTDGKTYVLQLNTANMAAGDIVELRVKVKVTSGGSAVTLYRAVRSGVQPYAAEQTPPIVAPYSVSFTLKQTAGTNRNFDYALISM